MPSYIEVQLTIEDMLGLLDTPEYQRVTEQLAVSEEVLREGGALVTEMYANHSLRARLKGFKKAAIQEKQASMKRLRQIRSRLGGIVRLNFRGTPLVSILEMQTRYKTVDDGANHSRKPRYDHREATEQSHFQMLIDNLSEIPQDARELLRRVGWREIEETELREEFARWQAGAKEQNHQEGQLAIAAARGRELQKQATRWYRNARYAAKILRDRQPELAGLINKAFPKIDMQSKRKKAKTTEAPKQDPLPKKPAVAVQTEAKPAQEAETDPQIKPEPQETASPLIDANQLRQILRRHTENLLAALGITDPNAFAAHGLGESNVAQNHRSEQHQPAKINHPDRLTG